MADNWEDYPAYDTLEVDGYFGPVTIEALQSFMQIRVGFYTGYDVDGVWGYYTAREFQRWLQSEGYYTGYATDGDAGYYTWSSYQNLLQNEGYGSTAAGCVGIYPWGTGGCAENLTRKMQRFLNRNRYSRVYSA